jgi:glycosyltransferase involved in cell wall biosynthesis
VALITVGSPVYNSMPYLPEVVNALLSQTARNFEILAIVQDCQDGSMEYMDSLRDPRLRIIRQPNPGLTPALNRMLREIHTPWLVRQDTDDIPYPHRIEELLDNISKYPEAGIFYSLAEYYPPDKAIGLFRASRGTPARLREIAKRGYLLSFCYSTVMLNAQKTLAVGGYRTGLVEDVDLWWGMALAYDIQFIPDILVGYRDHGSHITTSSVKRQDVQTLYVQYLLLSLLWDLPPQSVESIGPPLETLIDTDGAKAKEWIRQVNIDLTAGKYLGAFQSLLRSFISSPSYVIRRIADELTPNKQISNGLNPDIYKRRRHEFWPSSPEITTQATAEEQ